MNSKLLNSFCACFRFSSPRSQIQTDADAIIKKKNNSRVSPADDGGHSGGGGGGGDGGVAIESDEHRTIPTGEKSATPSSSNLARQLSRVARLPSSLNMDNEERRLYEEAKKQRMDRSVKRMNASDTSGESAELLRGLYANEIKGTMVVQEYLKIHPDCLEDFVYNHVGVDDLERLLIRKTHRQMRFSEDEESDLAPTCEDSTLRDGGDELESDSSFHETGVSATPAVADENAAEDAAAAAATVEEKPEPSRTSGLTRDRNSGIHLHRSLTATDSQHLNTRTPKDPKRLSLSKWKFCVHADKRFLLQELTRGITEGSRKVKVLEQLCASIARSVGADGYHIYFLNETKDTLVHWDVVEDGCDPSCDQNGLPLPKEQLQKQQQQQQQLLQHQLQLLQRQRNVSGSYSSPTSLRLPVGIGTTVPAYVAATRKTVLLKDLREIANDPRFPEGVGAGNEGAVSFLGQPILQADNEIVGVLALLRGDRRLIGGPGRAAASAWGDGKPMTTIFSVLTPESSTKDSTPEPDLAIVKEASDETESSGMARRETPSDPTETSQTHPATANSNSLPATCHPHTANDQSLLVPPTSPRRASNTSSASTTPQPFGVVAPPLSPRRSSTASSTSTQPFRLGEVPFAEEDEEIASSYLVWGGIAMYYAEMYVGLKKMRDLNTFLLEVVESIFEEIATGTVVSRILTKAKQLVEADRASLFLLDTKDEELYASVFDQDEKDSKQEIRFHKHRGFAGYVTSTGETLNIVDAYEDPRFNPDVDKKTGYRTRTVLCTPIIGGKEKNIIGAVQLVNKKGGRFTEKDKLAFQHFATYCGLALYNANLYDQLWKSEQRYKVSNEILAYHYTTNEEEVERIKQLPPHPISAVQNFDRFNYFGWNVDADIKIQYVLDMFYELFDDTMSRSSTPTPSSDPLVPVEGICEAAFEAANRNSRWIPDNGVGTRLQMDREHMLHFLLTIRKNYRQIPYHNWNHAFEVAHAMFCLLKTQHRFSMLEGVGLFIACLCHDVDHRGKTNSYMVKSASPLSALHTTSTLEHHHFKHTVTILQQDRHNIFARFSPAEYKEILKIIKHCILATDLVQFFKNKPMLEKIAGCFDWEDSNHKDLLMAVGMTACDLSSGYTKWEGSQQLAMVLMEEFWRQGDEEKKRGLTPIEEIEPILDRTQKDSLPKLEVQFILNVCLPCYTAVSRVIIEAKEMVKGAETNLEKWRQLAEKSGCAPVVEAIEPKGPGEEEEEEEVQEIRKTEKKSMQ